jgi:cell division protein FtsB
MGNPGNLLRKQVASEIRKRKLIFMTVISLSFIFLLISLIFGDLGLLKYKNLYKKKVRLEAQIKEIEQDNKQLKSQITSIKEDPYYKEKHAREDYGLAKQGELIFQYDR